MTTPDPDATARQASDATPYALPRRGAEVQFAPGTIVAGRYRISSILGSGGMGEVYRADDTKLNQTVALKFLPARLAKDATLLGRLHDEVRLGRQVAHPNVCHIYDIVDWEGAHFVAMEYVDGEDLSRLLRRIGRLAHDKAVEIARGIAAGLMAAHTKGILHRDLKPANVMVDARGDARVMDFGLALAAGEDDGTISGTPAYMAPEQLDGQPATIQSDLYALGLVMYELFTGKRAHNARTLPERVREISSQITTPSEVIRDIDPAVDRVILRCLSHDPAQRPSSAREVIASLPGGDPLAAAMAAGETPSPRIVAAAGAEGSLKPWQAWTMLVAVLLLTGLVLAGKQRFAMGQYAGFSKSPEVLAERTSTILRSVGIPEQPYASHTFTFQENYIGWTADAIRTPNKWERLRQGIAPVTFTRFEGAEPRPPGAPEDEGPGTARVDIDSRGRLVALAAPPLQNPKPQPPDWQPLLAAAGLDPRTLAAATPRLVPPSAMDARAAWSGRHPDDGTPIHVEAASWRGRPVFFRVTGAWENATMANVPFARPALAIFVIVVFVIVLLLGLLLAWHNLRARRGDRSSAWRMAAFMFLAELAATLLSANHQPSGMHEVLVIQRAIADALLWAGVVFVLYLALEPFVRRRWPATLIASTRLLSGKVRDPMIGRDVLIGMLVGVAHPALIAISLWLRSGVSDRPPFGGRVESLRGVRFALGHVLGSLSAGALEGFVLLVVLVAFMLVLRRRMLAVAGLGLVMMLGFYFALGTLDLLPIAITVMIVFVTARYGLLAIAMTQATFHTVFHFPFYTVGGWQAVNLIPLLALVAAALWSFRTSLGGQSPFSASLLDG
ncbi:MAG: serine/threonine-protein kinase [Acidobacteriota bacterium]